MAGTTESISNIKMDFSESSMIHNNLGGQGGVADDNDDDPLESGTRGPARPQMPRAHAPSRRRRLADAVLLERPLSCARGSEHREAAGAVGRAHGGGGRELGR